jgi:3-methyladenine DNA glycosylase/8-oxoguanine DNA glycosylase
VNDGWTAIEVVQPFDLAKTVAPVWWSGHRSAQVDWREGVFHWVGWEDGRIAWRSARQSERGGLEVRGSRDEARDDDWAAAVLGARQSLPVFDDDATAALAREHAGMRAWSAGSLYEGFVSAIVGQSISVAAAATVERRLCARFHAPIELAGRDFFPAPRPEQLADASSETIRECGVTRVRASALVAIGRVFAEAEEAGRVGELAESREMARRGLAIPGIGPWTVESALRWGIGDANAYPSGDIALLRAVRARHPEIASMRDLDLHARRWGEARGWAARLYWLDLLGFASL